MFNPSDSFRRTSARTGLILQRLSLICLFVAALPLLGLAMTLFLWLVIIVLVIGTIFIILLYAGGRQLLGSIARAAQSTAEFADDLWPMMPYFLAAGLILFAVSIPLMALDYKWKPARTGLIFGLVCILFVVGVLILCAIALARGQ